MCDRPISMMSMGTGDEQYSTAQLTDCSPRGLGLMAPEQLQAGQQVLIRLKLDRVVLLVYTIRYCIPMNASQFRTGARFTGYAASSFHGDARSVLTALTESN
jgi:hypothetical protein